MPDEIHRGASWRAADALRLNVRSTPYARESYRATASFRKAKSSFRSAVHRSMSQALPVPTTVSTGLTITG